MAAQPGRLMLLKIGDGADPTEGFTTVAGLRSVRVAFAEETVDVTNQSSAGRWRELLENAGVKSAEISGSGVFTDSASEESVRGAYFAGTVGNWQIIVPDYGTFEGAFQVTSIEYSGEHNGEAAYSLSLSSGGAVSFTAA